MTRWTEDYRRELSEAEPEVPESLSNRRADNWFPLFAIVEVAGGSWPKRLTDAAASLERPSSGAESFGVMLLQDMRTIFANQSEPRIKSDALIGQLLVMEERPWPEMPPDGKPLTKTKLAHLLKGFGIVPRQWRESGDEQDRTRGYMLADFQDAFARYLPLYAKKSRDIVTDGTIASAFADPDSSSCSGLGGKQQASGSAITVH